MNAEGAIVFGGLGLALGWVLWKHGQGAKRDQLTYHMVAQGDTAVNTGPPRGVAGPGIFVYGPANNQQVGQAPGLL